MPELPEVETTVRGLQKTIAGKTITGLWTDWPKYFRKTHKSAVLFKRHIVGKKITRVARRGKNILIHLSDDHILLIHQKLSGHLMVGSWHSPIGAERRKLPESWRDQKWVPTDPKSAHFWDSKNRFIRFLLFLSSFNPKPYTLKTKNSSMLTFSDLRRFGKILCGPKDKILNSPDLKTLGPEILDPKLTPKKFRELIRTKNQPIKQVLLDQSAVTGLGNIYADETLWSAKIHPLTPAKNLTDKNLSFIFVQAKKILRAAIKLGGTSMDDFRHVDGKKGGYEARLKAYHREGKPCQRCKTPIKRIKIGPRSAHFCPRCQFDAAANQ